MRIMLHHPFSVKIWNHFVVHTCFETYILQQIPMQLTKNLLYIKLRVVSWILLGWECVFTNRVVWVPIYFFRLNMKDMLLTGWFVTKLYQRPLTLFYLSLTFSTSQLANITKLEPQTFYPFLPSLLLTLTCAYTLFTVATVLQDHGTISIPGM